MVLCRKYFFHHIESLLTRGITTNWDVNPIAGAIGRLITFHIIRKSMAQPNPMYKITANTMIPISKIASSKELKWAKCCSLIFFQFQCKTKFRSLQKRDFRRLITKVLESDRNFYHFSINFCNTTISDNHRIKVVPFLSIQLVEFFLFWCCVLLN